MTVINATPIKRIGTVVTLRVAAAVCDNKPTPVANHKTASQSIISKQYTRELSSTNAFRPSVYERVCIFKATC
jgi:hypothetical protein